MFKFKEKNSIPVISVICAVCLIAAGLFYCLGPAGGDNGEKTKGSETAGGKKNVTVPVATGTRDPGPDGKYTVYIETGHGREDDGSWDSGCTWTDGNKTFEEAYLMIPIAKAMASYLRASGVEVVTDADSGNDKNLKDTLNFLDKHPEIDAFINLHCDWEESEPGTMPLYRTKEQLELAKYLNKGVHKIIDIKDRGETSRDDLDTLNSDKVHCPAVLFETGSIKEDNRILTKKFDAYGKGLAIGLCDYFGIDFKDNAW